MLLEQGYTQLILTIGKKLDKLI